MTPELPLDLIVCPACRAALSVDGDSLRCAACDVRFSTSGAFPELIPTALQERLREGGDPSWARWREAIRGLEAWRNLRRPGTGTKVFDDGTSDRSIRALFERAKVAGVVVDVGAKDGAKSRWMNGVTTYLGVDPFPVRANDLPAHATVVRALAEALPVKTRGVDAVVSIAAFDYFHDGFAALEEIGRVLKPDGRLALLVSVVSSTVAHARSARTRTARLTGALRAVRDVGLTAGAGLVSAALLERDRPHTHYYTRNQITSMVGVRFEIEGIEEVAQPASAILHIHARKKRSARLNVLR